MISLVTALVRFSAVLVLMLWLPGWIASRRPLLPLRVLHGFLLGAVVHVLALCITSLLTSAVERAVWVLPVVTFAVAFLLRSVMHRPSPAWDPPALVRSNAVVVAALVALAAVLRLLHNYHYDDLQHLYYLTELERQGVLFPQDLMLSLTTMTLPRLGEGSVMLSRYPFWAVSCVLLARLSGVVLGDAYLLLGLAALVLVLGQMAAFVTRAWSPKAAILWVLALVALGPLLSDSLLNYGGYPFQVGKLFVLLAATSLLVTWRTRRPDDLLPAGCGALIAPLLHTNNAVGIAGVLCLAVPMVFVVRLRRPLAVVFASIAMLGLVAAASLATRGFVRWMPEERLVARTPSTAPPVSVPSLAAPPPPAPSPAPQVIKDPVARRLAMFVSRGTPLELVVVVLALALVPLLRRLPLRASEWVRSALIAAAAGVVLLFFTADAARLALTSTLKPGYFRLRDSLLAVAPVIDPERPLLTDPITDVFGRAAGWRIPSAPPLGLEQQSLRLLAFHPAVRGGALDRVLAANGPATIVINEQVVGAGVSDKFEQLASLTRLAQWGTPAPAADRAATHASELVDAVYRLDPPALAAHGAQLVRDLRALLWSRPLTVFVNTAPKREMEPSVLGALIRGESSVQSDTQPFLNSALITLPHTAACVDGAELTLRNRASFDSPILVWPLDAVPPGHITGTEFRTLGLTGATATMPVAFGVSVCDTGPLSILVHSSYWWDFRFDVEDAEWKPSRSAE